MHQTALSDYGTVYSQRSIFPHAPAMRFSSASASVSSFASSVPGVGLALYVGRWTVSPLAARATSSSGRRARKALNWGT